MIIPTSEETSMPGRQPPVNGKVLVQVRLPKDLVRQIDHLCVDWDVYRAQLIEQILRERVKTYNGPA